MPPTPDPVWTRRFSPAERRSLSVEAGAEGGAGQLPLAGLRLAVKDLFAVRGCVMGCGNPHWAALQPPSSVTALAVRQLLAAGADCLGTTWLDEFAFGLSGENPWSGPAPNPRAPGRISGGSSSGSAAAVALAEADLALGTDTAGSIRAPASWCGLWGLRPSHGAVSTEAVAPLAPSLDTVGLFAASQAILRLGMEVLLPAVDAAATAPVRGIGWIPELWALADAAVTTALMERAEELAGRLGLPLQRWPLAELAMTTPETLQRLLEAVQWNEIAQCLGDLPPDLPIGPTLARNLELVRGRNRRLEDGAGRAHAALRLRMETLLSPTADGGGAQLLLLPCTPTVAPPCGSLGSDRSRSTVIQRQLQLGALASLAGLPQLAWPCGIDREEGLPVGLGVLSHAGADRLLLNLPLD